MRRCHLLLCGSLVCVCLACGMTAQATEVALRVVDQYGSDIALSYITVSGYGTYPTGETVDLANGAQTGSVHPGFNGVETGSAGQLTRSIEFTVDASTTAGYDAPLLGVYDLELVSPSSVVTKILKGRLRIDREVTR